MYDGNYYNYDNMSTSQNRYRYSQLQRGMNMSQQNRNQQAQEDQYRNCDRYQNYT